MMKDVVVLLVLILVGIRSAAPSQILSDWRDIWNKENHVKVKECIAIDKEYCMYRGCEVVPNNDCDTCQCKVNGRNVLCPLMSEKKCVNTKSCKVKINKNNCPKCVCCPPVDKVKCLDNSCSIEKKGNGCEHCVCPNEKCKKVDEQKCFYKNCFIEQKGNGCEHCVCPKLRSVDHRCEQFDPDKCRSDGCEVKTKRSSTCQVCECPKIDASDRKCEKYQFDRSLCLKGPCSIVKKDGCLKCVCEPRCRKFNKNKCRRDGCSILKKGACEVCHCKPCEIVDAAQCAAKGCIMSFSKRICPTCDCGMTEVSTPAPKTSVTTSTRDNIFEQCPTLEDCALPCTNLALDKSDCFMCKCQEEAVTPAVSDRRNSKKSKFFLPDDLLECKVVDCDKQCGNGDKSWQVRVVDNCDQCICTNNTSSCPKEDCTAHCPHSGYTTVRDVLGCPMCKCKKCKKLDCLLPCTDVGLEFKHVRGCPTCTCQCPARKFSIPGCKEYERDPLTGCEIAKCKTRHCPTFKELGCQSLVDFGCIAFHQDKNLGCPVCKCAQFRHDSKCKKTVAKCLQKNCGAHGVKKDKFGCPKANCACNCPPPPKCAVSCVYGFLKDKYGCRTSCLCREHPAKKHHERKAVEKMSEMTGRCKYKCSDSVCPTTFRRIDKNGCLTCDCCPEDRVADCPIYCTEGFVNDDTGCPICKCSHENTDCKCSCKPDKFFTTTVSTNVI